MTQWVSMGVNPLIIKGLAELGYANPTPIQTLAIPAAMAYRKDIVGAAETGSGKTLAFGIPIVNQLLEMGEQEWSEKRLRGLIISPTRELAMQIVEHLMALTKHTFVKILPLVGGLSTQKQERLVGKKPDIVVATPGRLWELMSSSLEAHAYLNDLDDLRFLVLDEADRIVEKGHFKDLEHILGAIDHTYEDEAEEEAVVATTRQTFVFSATMMLSAEARKTLGKRLRKVSTKKRKDAPDTLDRLMEMVQFKRKVDVIDLSPPKVTALNLIETKIECMTNEKDVYLFYFLKKYTGRTIVFVNSITCIRRLAPILKLLKVENVWPMHAQMQQKQRLKNIERFKQAKNAVIIATDVLSRGVDIPDIEHVVHYQTPRNSELYIHRSGRTARAQAQGLSLLLVSPEEHESYFRICKALDKGAKMDIKEFPVDHTFYKQLKERVLLAIEIDKLENKISKENHEQSWLKKAAEDMDIELDDIMVREHQDTYEEKQNKLKIKTMKAKLNALLDKPLAASTAGKAAYYAARPDRPEDFEFGKSTALNIFEQKEKK
eukprot:TRINITY_DN9502_c0_g1_i1.p1 TRINITY_DN9502_c0_g1~~TRINITY_DN9502_c0_g1_i1.p1  ORF type:complete len:547 (+),score=155.74 TRINITY_DN9502_c0_g1_i1:956-2596(+)